MQRDGKACLFRKLDLAYEHVTLDVARRQIVMEVEADLAKCPNARVAKASDKFFFDCIGIELGIVGMHADGNAHVGRLRVQPSSSRLQRSTIAPSRQLVEWKRPIFGRVDDLAHEIDPACRTTHELPCGIGQHVDMGM